jgi:hypothetical protein
VQKRFIKKVFFNTHSEGNQKNADTISNQVKKIEQIIPRKVLYNPTNFLIMNENGQTASFFSFC